MDDKLFEELIESVKEGGEILRGEREPSRKFEVSKKDVQAIRKEIGLAQDRFAEMMGISIKTLQNWEQGRRRPDGPARVLLRVAALHPEVLLEATREKRNVVIQGDVITTGKGTSFRRKMVQGEISPAKRAALRKKGSASKQRKTGS